MIVQTRANGSRTLAVAFLWITVAWNVAEGIIAVSAGFLAGSVALAGFGLDSFIEVAAAAVLLWRLGLPEHDERAEQRETVAHRIVGATFLLLAAYVIAEAAYVLVTRSEPEASPVGIALSLASLAVMPGLGLAKRRNAMLLGSRALIAESMETLLCSYLSVTLFAGLALNAAFGWWWADVAAALAMVPWIAREGLEGVRGESCEDD